MLSLLDVTYLEDKTEKAALDGLCANIKASPLMPAAICVYLRDIPYVKQLLSDIPIAIAPALNFPHGNASLQALLEEIAQAKRLDVAEVDVVIPYKAFLVDKDLNKVADFVALYKKELPGVKLKVILETGEINSPDNIKLLTQIACENGADFIKTSTGKVAVGATSLAVDSMILGIKAYYQQSGRKVGIKVSGGVRTIAQAQGFMAQVSMSLGNEWLTPDLFRIGTSQLFKTLCENTQGEEI